MKSAAEPVFGGALAALALVKVPGLILMPVGAVLFVSMLPPLVSSVWRAARLGRFLVVFVVLAIPFGLALRLFSSHEAGGAFASASMVLWVTAFVTVPGVVMYSANVLGRERAA